MSQYRERGYLLKEELSSKLFPEGERLRRAPFPLIECVENIPCNPCETSCPRGAIKIGENITDVPQIDFDKCNGCSICLLKCPGLAIFIADMREEGKAKLSIPYEFWPLPEVGSKCKCVDRAGKYVCEGEIVAVREMKKEKTHIVTAQFPEKFINEVRHFIIGEE
jgi:Fe-S-cluster-containing hydrogenase component 2